MGTAVPSDWAKRVQAQQKPKAKKSKAKKAGK